MALLLRMVLIVNLVIVFVMHTPAVNGSSTQMTVQDINSQLQLSELIQVSAVKHFRKLKAAVQSEDIKAELASLIAKIKALIESRHDVEMSIQGSSTISREVALAKFRQSLAALEQHFKPDPFASLIAKGLNLRYNLIQLHLPTMPSELTQEVDTAWSAFLGIYQKRGKKIDVFEDQPKVVHEELKKAVDGLELVADKVDPGGKKVADKVDPGGKKKKSGKANFAEEQTCSGNCWNLTKKVWNYDKYYWPYFRWIVATSPVTSYFGWEAYKWWYNRYYYRPNSTNIVPTVSESSYGTTSPGTADKSFLLWLWLVAVVVLIVTITGLSPVRSLKSKGH